MKSGTLVCKHAIKMINYINEAIANGVVINEATPKWG